MRLVDLISPSSPSPGIRHNNCAVFDEVDFWSGALRLPAGSSAYRLVGLPAYNVVNVTPAKCCIILVVGRAVLHYVGCWAVLLDSFVVGDVIDGFAGS